MSVNEQKKRKKILKNILLGLPMQNARGGAKTNKINPSLRKMREGGATKVARIKVNKKKKGKKIYLRSERQVLMRRLGPRHSRCRMWEVEVGCVVWRWLVKKMKNHKENKKTNIKRHTVGPNDAF